MDILGLVPALARQAGVVLAANPVQRATAVQTALQIHAKQPQLQQMLALTETSTASMGEALAGLLAHARAQVVILSFLV